jgi:hypothetical protein
LTETEENFIGMGQMIQAVATGMEHLQEQVLGMAARHVALDKRFDALEKLVKKLK